MCEMAVLLVLVLVFSAVGPGSDRWICKVHIMVLLVILIILKAVQTFKQPKKKTEAPTLEHKAISRSDSILYAKVQPEL